MTDINATLLIAVSTSGFTALQPSTPTQRFTPASGQRAYTIADAITSLNEQINSNTDPTTAPDSPDVLYNFVASTDGMIIIDNMSVASDTDSSVWDNDFNYIQGAWG